MRTTVTIDDAELAYEQVGAGPVLVVIGGAASGVGVFARLAAALAHRFTVITYDRRGTHRSTGRRGHQVEIAQDSDDVAAVLDTIGATTAAVFATCGGASTGFDLAARRPDLIRTLVAHEPMTIRVLDDADKQRAAIRDLCVTNEFEGPAAAMRRWMRLTRPDVPPVIGPESQALLARDGDYVVRCQVMSMVEFVPDCATLRTSDVRIAVAVGNDSLRRESSGARIGGRLAELLSCPVRTFPGHHTSYVDRPAEFSQALVDTIECIADGSIP
ncbi:alpha/beta fold hydrolase [Nocardia brevicatena]|uniref:alpha/beta fold hydrolase n=1 Tax=Nocardia brevicatena TaxID=37327 RepID=UPI0002E0C4CE|nr:alpha/beta hydrolase [Nocardia brevicatena]